MIANILLLYFIFIIIQFLRLPLIVLSFLLMK